MAAGGDRSQIFTLKDSRYVINNVLFFVCTWISTEPFDWLSNICVNFFSEDEIAEAKAILFEATTNAGRSSRLIKRRDGVKPKRVADMEDLLREFLAVDGDASSSLPIFLADNGRRLPSHMRGIQVGNDVLLTELSSVCKKITGLEEKLLQVVSEVRTIAVAESVPKVSAASPIGCSSNHRVGSVTPIGGENSKANSGVQLPSRPGTYAEAVNRGNPGSSSRSFRDSVVENSPGQDGFKVVENRKRKRQVRPSIVGSKQGGSGPKGVVPAAEACWLYVGHCEPGTTVQTLTEDLQEEGLSILDGKQLSTNSTFCSFRLQIPRNSLEKALNPAVWGEGIRVRKFFFGRRFGWHPQTGQPAHPQKQVDVTQAVQNTTAAQQPVDAGNETSSLAGVSGTEN